MNIFQLKIRYLTFHINPINMFIMRALKKFKIQEKLTYKQLHKFLNDKGLKISFSTVLFYCLDFECKSHVEVSPTNVYKLAEITNIKAGDFYRDIPMAEVYSDLAKAVGAAV